MRIQAGGVRGRNTYICLLAENTADTRVVELNNLFYY